MRLFGKFKQFLGGLGPASEPGSIPARQAPVEGDAQDAAEESRMCYENAVRFFGEGRIDASLTLLEEATRLRPDFAGAHLLLGRIHKQLGQIDDASDHYLLAGHHDAGLEEPWLELGQLARDRGDFEEAGHYLEKAVALRPANAAAHNMLGAILHELNVLDSAIAHFRRAIDLQPDLADAHSNLGYVLFRDLEQFDDGARHIRTALDLAPHHAAALGNWTMVLQQQGRFEESLELSTRLLTANPELHEVRLNRALLLLTRARFAPGWADYEARRQVRGFVPSTLPWPEWNGESLQGKSVHVYGEQGLGDQIMFASCLPDLISGARRCTVDCAPKLRGLFRRSFPGTEIVMEAGNPSTGDSARRERIDYRVAMGSIPRFLRNEVTDFPRHAGYLSASPSRVAYWKSRLDPLGAGIKVGISWRGGRAWTRRSMRSIALEHWLPILHCGAAAFVNLQYDECRDEIEVLQARHGIRVHHWEDAIADYDETAALVSALDLVVTVQTAVGHLAGALGKAAWVMIAATPEWRYLDCGERMPWYPSVRLFRQQRLGEWGCVVGEVAAALRIAATGGPRA